MNYACELDVIKLDFPVQSLFYLYSEISKQLANFLENPELFNIVDSALRLSAEKSGFVMEEGALVLNSVISVIDRPIHMYFRLKEGLILSNAPANKPVVHVPVLLSPKSDGPLHLRRLSRLARQVGQVDFREKLSSAQHADDARNYFFYPEEFEQAA